MKYKSVYEYLDEVFSEKKNPSNEEIVKAKKAYWKLYFRHYHKQRRKTRKEFTLGFEPEMLSKIKNKKGSLSTSKFLYQAVCTAIDNNSLNFIQRDLLAEIQQQLMLIISYIEENLLDDKNELAYETIAKIEELELKIHNIQNYDNKEQSN
ncbi:hypothetical protein MB09_01540 [Aequorivita vladivostokensis]|uniref:Phage protein n=2 Tax=Aequorivita vladivostokensis TaxID=171194 RepID=A0ABR5DM67_9FLAO|nr:hypothetical protein MB09_01540 [Aequorivita vladivostokensis]